MKGRPTDKPSGRRPKDKNSKELHEYALSLGYSLVRAKGHFIYGIGDALVTVSPGRSSHGMKRDKAMLRKTAERVKATN